MTTTPVQSASVSEPFPQNLTHWTGEAGLARLAEEIAQDTWTTIGVGQNATTPAGAGAPLLAVLAGSYAAGIFAFEDIKWAAEAKPLVRTLSRGRDLSFAALQRFKGTHGRVLETCLSRLIYAAWQTRPVLAHCAGSGVAGRELERLAAALVEARRRIRLAMQFDLAFSE